MCVKRSLRWQLERRKELRLWESDPRASAITRIRSFGRSRRRGMERVLGGGNEIEVDRSWAEGVSVIDNVILTKHHSGRPF